MSNFIFKFILTYFIDIMLYLSLILVILILLGLFFIIKNKVFLMKRLHFLLNNNIILFVILLFITFFLLLLLIFCIFSFILYWFYVIYYIIEKSNDLLVFINLFIIYDNFYEINILILYITFILSYIINLIWFYYIFIYKNENKEFVHLFNVLLYLLCLIIILSILLYNIDIPQTIIEINNHNVIFSINFQKYRDFNVITVDVLENVNLKNNILFNKAIVCYFNKNFAVIIKIKY